jgi:hypothetical protein
LGGENMAFLRPLYHSEWAQYVVIPQSFIRCFAYQHVRIHQTFDRLQLQ